MLRSNCPDINELNLIFCLLKAHLGHLAFCQRLSDHDTFPTSPTSEHGSGLHATDHLS